MAPLKIFAIFNGLMILSCYFLCIFLFFPCLILYDRWLQEDSRSSFVQCHCCHQLEGEIRKLDNDFDHVFHEEERPSLVRRVMLKYYQALHFSRWVVIAITVAALVVCGYFTASLELPATSDVRVLDKRVEYQKYYEWNLKLLSKYLVKNSGSTAFVLWGVRPADTGNHNNPDELSKLVLDDSFDPSSEAAQLHLKRVCDQFFDEAFAGEIFENDTCSINQFESWLRLQSNTSNPDEAYLSNCAGASRLPVSQEAFHDCLLAWRELSGDQNVLHRNGIVKIIMLPYHCRVRYDNSFSALNKEWQLTEAWMNDHRKKLHYGVANST